MKMDVLFQTCISIHIPYRGFGRLKKLEHKVVAKKTSKPA
jgi:hypothetical protein